jgi:regulator of sigma E protease
VTYLLIALAIGFLILVHELGHLLAAKWTGIPVARFSIGFGPKLCGWRWGETEYWLAPIPLGGYVLPAVQDDAEFSRIPLARRVVFALGGPLANLLLPVVLFAVLNVMAGNVSLSSVLVAPWVQTGDMLEHFVRNLPLVFQHPDQLSGVVGIVAIGDQIVHQAGIAGGLTFAILQSINLAVLNMLPLPPLDGGKILMYVLEKVHPRLARLHVPLAAAGWLGLLALMTYTTVLDIARHVIGAAA